LPKSRGAARRGRGIAFSLGFGSYNAQVVEVTMRGRAITIDRILCVFDCGLKIDPRAVDAQVVGGIVWGLSATRDGQITFADGAAQETNFHTSPILRINELPPIEVHLVDSEAKPGGCGETSVPTVAPALANAIFAATSRRPRRLPLVADGYTFS
jgi:CO/xanthine dehydrogenase Mo-binding subunit